MSPWESLGISLVLLSVYAFGICVGVKIQKESAPEDVSYCEAIYTPIYEVEVIE